MWKPAVVVLRKAVPFELEFELFVELFLTSSNSTIYTRIETQSSQSQFSSQFEIETTQIEKSSRNLELRIGGTEASDWSDLLSSSKVSDSQFSMDK